MGRRGPEVPLWWLAAIRSWSEACTQDSVMFSLRLGPLFGLTLSVAAVNLAGTSPTPSLYQRNIKGMLLSVECLSV